MKDEGSFGDEASMAVEGSGIEDGNRNGSSLFILHPSAFILAYNGTLMVFIISRSTLSASSLRRSDDE